ncbi:MAG: methyltransferase domain-containing protein [Rhodospirillaceae bacterium]|nr:methyltransferase domain-containing protein [Rhodospirillaceae bacterium]MBT3886441.1 methyltransferase domain-containing protein [Rhodospirillaceae bacterium]MBT4115482.1 methyltransferase domain-containing protein [Rhodospirillaceae bacterium]MBT4673567.1 methyltransferase domain-containing protein [Rhodospirillaceae bacterium]MBT4719840.1 methyltransferase domain-containing protein [Rhodospirillaceae bacterium]
MSEAYHRRSDCRLCGGVRLTQVLRLTPTPPANAFASEAAPQETFPLDLFFCEDCAHLQLLDVIDPEILFRDYVYVSGTSPSFVAHFGAYAADCVARFGLGPGDLAVDIGSNDGTLLGFFKKSGLDVLGIDPARKIAAEATKRGIETWPEFFGCDVAMRIRGDRGAAKIITANNVFAHADDLDGIAAAARALLADDGVFQFEVSYAGAVYEHTLFDTIYHEHVACHSVQPLQRFFAKHGLELFSIAPINSQGGSIRAMVQLAGGPHGSDGSVDTMIGEEKSLGLDRPETWIAFADKIDALKIELRALLDAIKASGKTIAGFGAPAKATTLMYHFGIGADDLDFIADDSPLKQGLYSPGLHIPVLAASEIYVRNPDYLLILAWNFAAPIIAKHRRFSESGGQFIIPLPKLEVQ